MEERKRITREGWASTSVAAPAAVAPYDLLRGSAWLGLFCAVGFVSQSVALVHTSASKCAFACGLGMYNPLPCVPLQLLISPPLLLLRRADAAAVRCRREMLETAQPSGRQGAAQIRCHEATLPQKRLHTTRARAGWGGHTRYASPTPARPQSSSSCLPLEYNGLGEPAQLEDALLLVTPLSFSLCFWLAEKHSRRFPDSTEAITGIMLSTVAAMTFMWTVVTQAFPTTLHSLLKFVSLHFPLDALFTAISLSAEYWPSPE